MDSAELNRKIQGLAIVSRNNAGRTAEIQAELAVHLPNVKCIAPADLDEMHEAVRASADWAELVIAVGGDGTLHQVLNTCDPQRQILGILPMGTGNDFARQIGYSGVLADRVWQLSTLRPRPTDYGTVAGIRYHNSAGIGLDGATLAYRRRMPRLLAKNYTLAFCCTLAGMQPVIGKIKASGFERHGMFWWLLAMNNQHIGGGTRITPDAKIDDGRLDMLLVDRIPKPAVLTLMPAALKGNHLGRRGVYAGQFAEITLTLDVQQEWLAVDGELYPLQGQQVKFECHPGAMRFLR